MKSHFGTCVALGADACADEPAGVGKRRLGVGRGRGFLQAVSGSDSEPPAASSDVSCCCCWALLPCGCGGAGDSCGGALAFCCGAEPECCGSCCGCSAELAGGFSVK